MFNVFGLDGLVPVGTVVPYAGPLSDASRAKLKTLGWLECDGRWLTPAKSPTEGPSYGELFGVIGYTYGKRSPTASVIDSALLDFRLPDLRGQFLRGVAVDAKQDPGLRDRVKPQDGEGRSDGVGSRQKDMITKHFHQFTPSGAESLGNQGKGSLSAPPKAFTEGLFSAPNEQSTLSGEETRPVNTYVYFIIKYRTARPAKWRWASYNALRVFRP